MKNLSFLIDIEGNFIINIRHLLINIITYDYSDDILINVDSN